MTKSRRKSIFVTTWHYFECHSIHFREIALLSSKHGKRKFCYRPSISLMSKQLLMVLQNDLLQRNRVYVTVVIFPICLKLFMQMHTIPILLMPTMHIMQWVYHRKYIYVMFCLMLLHYHFQNSHWHYSDVTMGVMASQISSVSINLLNRLFRHKSKKTSKLRVTGICEGNSSVTGDFPAQRASNVKTFSIWWRHPEICELNRSLHLPRLTWQQSIMYDRSDEQIEPQWQIANHIKRDTIIQNLLWII